MIRYTLACERQHSFESWFQNSAAFDKQAKRGLVTRTVDTGPGGENDPNRALVSIVAAADAAGPQATLPANPEPLPQSAVPWVGDVKPVRVRKLFFSEHLKDPNDPTSADVFYLTVDGQTPAPFDPSSDVPDIVVKQDDVEDWIIENRSSELHDFHIHQTHFLLLERDHETAGESYLLDTVDVPYWDVKVDPSIIKNHGDLWNPRAEAMMAAIFRMANPMMNRAAKPRANLQRTPDPNRVKKSNARNANPVAR